MHRRDALKSLTLAGAAAALRIDTSAQGEPLAVGGALVDVLLTSISASTIRVTFVAHHLPPPDLAVDGALVAVAENRAPRGIGSHSVGDFNVTVSSSPVTVRVNDKAGRPVQELTLDDNGSFLFNTGGAPLLAFGEGGPQFDRRGSVDAMRNGQGGYQLRTHGGRVPIQWLIGTEGWGLFIHQPFGTFDLKGPKGKMTSQQPLPTDCFLVASKEPATIMREYARITGLPEMPPLWSFGYQQSHRTLAGPEEIKRVATTMREKKLPCDTLIYLGTDFCPSGWNTHNGEFEWKKENFPEPKKQIDELHALNYKVVLHIVIEGRRLTGTVNDPCGTPERSGRTPDAAGDVTKGTWPPDRPDNAARARAGSASPSALSPARRNTGTASADSAARGTSGRSVPPARCAAPILAAARRRSTSTSPRVRARRCSSPTAAAGATCGRASGTAD